MSIDDTLMQEPVEAFKPDVKQTDVPLDSIPPLQDDTRDMHPISGESVWKGLRIETRTRHILQSLKQIVLQHLSAFSRCTDDIGNFTGWTYPLTQKANTRPVFQRQFPIPEAKKGILSRWVGRMKRARVIARCVQTRWSTPVFVVPKKNGEFRLVSDIRKVNEVLEDDFLPSRPVPQLLGEIQATRSKFFSTMDIQSAFFSIRYTPGTNFPTAFYADCRTHLDPRGRSLTGKYIYKRLVMGCQSSSAALFRVMSYVLHGIPGCKVYCDDIMVYSQTEEEHLAILQVLIIVIGLGVAIFWYLKKNSTSSIIEIMSGKINELVGNNTKSEDVTLNIRYEEVLGEVNQLKETLEGFQQKQRQDDQRRIIRREGAKLWGASQSEPAPLAQLPMKPTITESYGVLSNGNYPTSTPETQEQEYVPPYQKRTLFSAVPLGDFRTPPITYRRY